MKGGFLKKVGGFIADMFNPLSWFDVVPISKTLPTSPTAEEDRKILQEMKEEVEFYNLLKNCGEYRERKNDRS